MSSVPWLDRLRQLPAAVVDTIVVVAVAVPTMMDAWWNEPGIRQADGYTYLLAAVSVLALFGRRRWPWGVALVSGSALSALYVMGHQDRKSVG